MKRRLLGYDLRVELIPNKFSDWPAERRDTFLIAPDISYPLGVNEHYGWPRADSLRPPESDSNLPSVHWLSGYWLSLQALREFQRNFSPTYDNDIAVCVAMFSLADHQRPLVYPEGWEENFAYEMEPDSIQPSWRSLGFDIADEQCVSAVSNCGISPQEKLDAHRKRWRPLVNEWGLLKSMSDAEAFRDWAEIEIPEHTPFLIYELFAIDEIVAK